MRSSTGSMMLSSAVLLVACGGKAINVGTGAMTGNNVGPEVFTPAQVQAARAQCSQPDGPVQTFATIGAVQTAITGSWLLCSTQSDPGDDPSGSSIASSREYDANGQWVNLGLDAQGGLVRVYGADNQGDWEVGGAYVESLDAGPDASLEEGAASLIWHVDSGGGNGGPVAFESSPPRMEWQPDYFEAWYVPLGQ
jgi:hypothetical protein